jgi:hypothetical protein
LSNLKTMEPFIPGKGRSFSPPEKRIDDEQYILAIPCPECIL